MGHILPVRRRPLYGAWRRGGAEPRSWRGFLSQVSSLPRSRDRGEEQVGSGAQRIGWAPSRDDRGLSVLARREERRLRLGSDQLRRVRRQSEGEDSREQDGFRGHQGRNRNSQSLALSLAL